MSGVKVLYALAKAHAPLMDLVPQTRIVSGVLPRNVALPAINFTRISGRDLNIPAPGSVRHVSERIQATVHARDLTELLAVMAQLRKACADKMPNMASLGLTNVTVHTGLAGPDFMNEENNIHLRSQDFEVQYNETR